MRTAARWPALGLALLLAGCDFPTQAPLWDQTWVVPVERITVGAAELLPDSVTVSADGSTFQTRSPGAAISLSLADMCGTPCVLAAGQTAPKPAFQDTLTTQTTLPGGLVAAVLAGGAFDARLGHSLSFDPLRPSAHPDSARGYVVIRLTSAGSVIAEDSIDGADAAFPDTVTLLPELPIQPVTVNDTIDVMIVISSPSGDSTTIDPTDTLGVTFEPSIVAISEVTVEASGLTIDSVTTALSFGDLDSTTVGRVQRGALRLAIQNAFGITGSLDMTFRGEFPTIEQQVDIRSGSYVERIEFTGSEVQQILLSETAEVVASGSASATGGTLTVEPPDALVLDAEFELVIRVGPNDEPPG